MKTLICIPVYNRFHIASVCIGQMLETLDGNDCALQITDDGSTDPGSLYNSLFLTPPDEVIHQLHLGIDQTRANQLRYFWDHPEYDRLYLTDSDAYHDPDWHATALDILSQHNLPVSLYRSNTGIHPCDHLGLGKTAPGISMFFTRAHVEPLIYALPQIADGGWDWQVCRFLDRWIFSQESHLEHYGEGGLHNQTMMQDRADKPTKYLALQEFSVFQEIDKARAELQASGGVVVDECNAIDVAPKPSTMTFIYK